MDNNLLKKAVVNTDVLAQKREELNLKQQDVGDLVDRSNKDISHYENKRAVPDGNVLLRMMLLYDLSPADLVKVEI